jgi:hypothetical protein
MAPQTCNECGTKIPFLDSKCPKCGHPIRSESKESAFNTYVFLTGVLIIIGMLMYRLEHDKHEATSRMIDAEHTRLEKIKIVTVGIFRNPFLDNRFEISSLTIENESDMAVKDIVISCTGSAPSGTMIDFKEMTIYDVLPSEWRLTFKLPLGEIFNPQVSSVTCRVKSAPIKY